MYMISPVCASPLVSITTDLWLFKSFFLSKFYQLCTLLPPNLDHELHSRALVQVFQPVYHLKGHEGTHICASVRLCRNNCWLVTVWAIKHYKWTLSSSMSIVQSALTAGKGLIPPATNVWPSQWPLHVYVVSVKLYSLSLHQDKLGKVWRSKVLNLFLLFHFFFSIFFWCLWRAPVWREGHTYLTTVKMKCNISYKYTGSLSHSESTFIPTGTHRYWVGRSNVE